jgi:CRISPR-associated exonuclease Cas4
MIYLSLFFFISGLFLLLLARRQRKTTGLPGGQIIYADTSKWTPLEKPLYDPELGLSGKPDYLVEQAGTVIPVEVKSNHIADAPYDSHIFQLAAYCHLVSHQYKHRPPYGIIHYPNRTFRIDYTAALEEDLQDILIDMRTAVHSRQVFRSHQSSQRCAGCGYNSICDQRLS